MTALPDQPAAIPLSRYRVQRPECPCYRAGTRLSTEFGEPELREAIAGSNGDPIPRPLTVRLHFPQPGTLRARDEPHSFAAAYVQRLRREIELTAALFDRDRQLDQVHLLDQPLAHLTLAQVMELLDALPQHFTPSGHGRMHRLIELDPLTTPAADVAALADAGFDAVALLLQEGDPLAGPAPQTSPLLAAPALIRACHRHGLHTQVHLAIGALPLSATARDAAIQRLLESPPDRISLRHRLEGEDGSETLPKVCPERSAGRHTPRAAPLLEHLQRAGYRHLGLCNFVHADDPLVRAREDGRLHCNLIGYTERGDCDIVGLGVDANSHIGACLSQNPRQLAHWEAALDMDQLPVWRGMRLDEEDLLRAEVVQHLVCRGELDFIRLSHQYGIDFRQHFSAALARLDALASHGFLLRGPHSVRTTALGHLHLSVLSACFDVHTGNGIVPGAQRLRQRV